MITVNSYFSGGGLLGNGVPVVWGQWLAGEINRYYRRGLSA